LHYGFSGNSAYRCLIDGISGVSLWHDHQRRPGWGRGGVEFAKLCIVSQGPDKGSESKVLTLTTQLECRVPSVELLKPAILFIPKQRLFESALQTIFGLKVEVLLKATGIAGPVDGGELKHLLLVEHRGTFASGVEPVHQHCQQIHHRHRNMQSHRAL